MERSCGRNPKQRTTGTFTFFFFHFAVPSKFELKRKKNFPYLLPPRYLLGMPHPTCFDFIPLCNMKLPGKSVFPFSMELSAQQKNQVYHVCRVAKKIARKS